MFRLSSPALAVLTLLFVFQVVTVVTGKSGIHQARRKREWILPPLPLMENEDYTKKEFIAKIRSDLKLKYQLHYRLEGRGASEVPYHVFTVDPDLGWIRVTRILDREEFSVYNLLGVATAKNGSEPETRIGIKVEVKDKNDNTPIFSTENQGAVKELSNPGTPVMTINATDKDEPENDNSKISYRLISQDPPHNMFYIKKDGTVCVNSPLLDREKQNKYTLKVIGADLDGRPGGNTGTGTVTINVLDVNDHLPTLEKEEYEGEIEENTKDVAVMKLKASDLDLKGTENWEAVFDIVKGNEAGYFSIKKDPENNNEGILMLVKPVDYEKVKSLDLGIVVRNKVPQYDGSTASVHDVHYEGDGEGGGGGGGGSSGTGSTGSSWQSGTKFKSYPLKIKVKNAPEGPAFIPEVKAIPLLEGGSTVKVNDVIARYPAIDGDTLEPAKKVRYVKGSDPGNWLTIDPKTAEIKLNKLPDRESPYLVNGTYLAKVLCISEEMPFTTAVGTVAIQVEDFNDNCPIVTSNHQTMCTTANHVIVIAKDEDVFPNGAPFVFNIIPEGTEGKWQVEPLNDTAAILRAQEEKWPGFYKVTFEVKDAQGEACSEPQEVEVQVCTCEDGVVCGKRGAQGQLGKGAGLGPGGIGLLFLGLLLLLLIPLLLLFCQCGGAAGTSGGFKEMPFDTKSHLINYRTEGQGENTEVPLLNLPTQMDGGLAMTNIQTTMAPMTSMGFQHSVASMDMINYGEGYQREGAWGTMNEHRGSGFYSEMESRESGLGGGLFDGMALPDYVLADYYSQKLASGNENLGVKDGILVYDYEGNGSPAGSVGSAGDLESDNGIQFLDDLGLKFKTLAEVCGGKKIQTEVKKVRAPAQTSVSSVITAQQLPPPPQVQPTIPQAERTVVRETVKESTVREGMTKVNEGMTRVNEGMANQGQMFMLQQQQPVYYTTTPMIQPMHYVVQPQVQNTVLLAEAPSTNLQGMVLVNGTQTLPSQGMMVQGQSMISTAQAQGPGMMLVGGSGVHTGIPSGAQTMMVVEGKVPAGSLKRMRGSQTSVMQGGTLQSGGFSGTQRVMVVGGPTSSQGQLIQEAGGLSPTNLVPGSSRVRKGSTSARSHSSSTTTTVSTGPTIRKVVVKESKEIR